jgi:hypothetical protein
MMPAMSDKDLPAAYDPTLIRRDLAMQSREPFKEALARLLEAMPSVEEIKAFAAKTPDRWAQAVAIVSRPAGVTEKHELTFNNPTLALAYALLEMSDSEVEARRVQHAQPPKALTDKTPSVLFDVTKGEEGAA